MKAKKQAKKSTAKVEKKAPAKKRTAPKENPVVASLKSEVIALKECIKSHRETEKKLRKKINDLKTKLTSNNAKPVAPTIVTLPINKLPTNAVEPISAVSPFIKSNPAGTEVKTDRPAVLMPNPNRVFSHNLDAVASDPITPKSDNWVAVPFPCK